MKIQIDNNLPIKELVIPVFVGSPTVYTFGVIDGYNNDVDVYSEEDDYLNGVMYGKELLFNENTKEVNE